MLKNLLFSVFVGTMLTGSSLFAVWEEGEDVSILAKTVKYALSQPGQQKRFSITYMIEFSDREKNSYQAKVFEVLDLSDDASALKRTDDWTNIHGSWVADLDAEKTSSNQRSFHGGWLFSYYVPQSIEGDPWLRDRVSFKIFEIKDL